MFLHFLSFCFYFFIFACQLDIYSKDYCSCHCNVLRSCAFLASSFTIRAEKLGRLKKYCKVFQNVLSFTIRPEKLGRFYHGLWFYKSKNPPLRLSGSFMQFKSSFLGLNRHFMFFIMGSNLSLYCQFFCYINYRWR